MRMSLCSEEKINIHCSEMSTETVESYEKLYKNLNDVQREDSRESEMNCKENNSCENDFYSEEKRVSGVSKHCIDSNRKRVKDTFLETSCDALPNKKRKKDLEPPKLKEPNRDIFCWRCHKYVPVLDVIPCYFCPRVFHLKCAHIQEKPSAYWLCTECDAINAAENPDKIPSALSKLEKKDLAELLMFVMKRMRQHEGSPHFENPVDAASYPDYKDYIVKPMYLSLLEHNVKNQKYASCESFLADTKWMVHNSYVFNTVHSELTLYAKAMMKNAKHECDEIINCPDCYSHANTLDEDRWFIEPCEKPHILVWARLKGFPYWPCKVMKASGSTVDVRFFGDHNKSLVPVDCCFLYSKQMPSKQKKVDELGAAIKEACLHIKRLEEKFHVFQYAPVKTLYNPKQEDEQRKLLLPYHDQPFFIKVKDKEKLFGPKIIKSVCEESFSNYNYAVQPEENNRNISAISNEADTDNKKSVKTHNEEIPTSKHPLINKSTAAPLTKPKIIIEESDSDVLSNGSHILPWQHRRKCENINLSYINNKPELVEKQTVKLISQQTKENDNRTLIVPQRVNYLKSHSTDNEKLPSPCLLSEKNCKPVNNSKDVNFSPEKIKSDGKKDNSISEQLNSVPLTCLSLDLCGNKIISDKLGINSNAKLISVITDNPALINNNMLNPLVVVRKLEDDVLRDYSEHICRKPGDFTNDKVSVSDIRRYSNRKLKKSANQLSFDLLNGNIANFVSVTEIDLDKDGILQESNSNCDQEANNVKKCYSNEENDNLRCSEATIKTEKIEDGDDHVDYDYIEQLSKSILESSFDFDDKTKNNPLDESTDKSLIKNSSYEEISSIERESLTKTDNDEMYNFTPDKLKSIVGTEKVTLEDMGETLNQKNADMFQSIGGNSNVESKGGEVKIGKEIPVNATQDEKSTSTLDDEASNVCDKVPYSSSNGFEFQTNDNKGNKIDNVIENDISLRSTETLLSKESIDNITSTNKKDSGCSVENIMSLCEIEREAPSGDETNLNQKEGLNTSESESFFIIDLENDQNNTNEDHSNKINSKEVLISTESMLKKGKDFTTQNLQKEAVTIHEQEISESVNDSDCEIINITFPENGGKILKPIGSKKGKITGRIIRRFMKNGVLLPGCRKRHDLSMLGKRNDDHIQSSETKCSGKGFRVSRLSSNCLKISPKSPTQSFKLKKICNVKQLNKKSPINVDKIEKVQEENNVMSLDIEEILGKFKEIDPEGNRVEILRKELEKFMDKTKKKFESYKSAFIEEMDSLYNMEKQRWIQESMNVCKNESEMMVDEIKKKSWCILCLSEAKFHCCWGTNYCSEKCQLADWPVHCKACTQYEMRVGDPDIRLNPEIKQTILRGSESVRGLKFKDDINKPNESPSKVILPASSTSSCSNFVNTPSASLNNSANITPISSKSTILIPKSVVKQDLSQELMDPHRRQLVKKTHQAIQIPGISLASSQNKSIIHVPKQNHVKSINTQDLDAGLVASQKQSILFTVPLSNRNSSVLSFTSSKHNGNFNSHAVIMSGEQIVLPKTFLPTKVIKKKLPAILPKNVGCLQKNVSTLMKSKPLFIAVSNPKSRDPLANNDGNETPKLKEPTEENSSQNSSQSRDSAKSARSFVIVDKNGETSKYTYKVGFQESAENLPKVNILPPLLQKQIVGSVLPLSYPVLCCSQPNSVEPVSNSIPS